MTDEYQSIPVAVARAAVQASGELEGIEGPFYLADTIDAPEWEPFFSKVLHGASGHPEFAKVIITRKGQKPREVVIAWDEYAEQMDADPEWDALRASKPMSIFGAEVERHAYRVVFADVLGKIEAPRPQTTGVYSPQGDRAPDESPAAGWDLPARDWFAEVKAADAVKLNSLTDEAREAGALKSVEGLQKAFMDRLLQIERSKSVVPKPTEPPRARPNRRRGKRAS